MTTTIVASVDIKINASAFIKKMETVMAKRMDKVAALGVEIIQRTLAQSNARGLSPSAPGSSPRRGNSNLMGSMYWRNIDQLSRAIGSTATYARAQELGASITGRNMPIPISDEAKRHRTRGGKARDFPGKLVPIRASNGKLLLIQKKSGGKSEGRNWKIHYLLSNTVRLQERPFLRPLSLSSR